MHKKKNLGVYYILLLGFFFPLHSSTGGDAVKFIMIRQNPKFLRVLIPVVTLSLLALGIGIMPQAIRENQENMPEQVLQIPITASNERTTIKIHKVSQGETIESIAKEYNIDVETLRGANANLGEELRQGEQVVILPSNGVLHITDMGDTLWRIANLYGINVGVIMKANGKVNEDLYIGEKIFIPGGIKPKQREIARTDVPVSRNLSERFVWPTSGELTSNFGYRWGRLHEGIDLANEVGTTIRAARSGRVTYAGWYEGYGYVVLLEHDQGYTTRYGHLHSYFVTRGQYVKGGQVIASMGNTGNSTGPHLHFEVRKNNVPINPYTVLP